MQINFESESLRYLLHSLSLSEQNPCYRNNAIELAEQYKVDFHHNFILDFDIKVNSIRAWDYPKIAVCTDTGCACYSLKSYSPVGTPRKIPLHFTTDIFLPFGGV